MTSTKSTSLPPSIIGRTIGRAASMRPPIWKAAGNQSNCRQAWRRPHRGRPTWGRRTEVTENRPNCCQAWRRPHRGRPTWCRPTCNRKQKTPAIHPRNRSFPVDRL